MSTYDLFSRFYDQYQMSKDDTFLVVNRARLCHPVLLVTKSELLLAGSSSPRQIWSWPSLVLLAASSSAGEESVDHESKPRETAWSRPRSLPGLRRWTPDRMVMTEGVPVNLTLQLIRREN
jgi:hypothetical protein